LEEWDEISPEEQNYYIQSAIRLVEYGYLGKDDREIDYEEIAKRIYYAKQQ